MHRSSGGCINRSHNNEGSGASLLLIPTVGNEGLPQFGSLDSKEAFGIESAGTSDGGALGGEIR